MTNWELNNLFYLFNKLSFDKQSGSLLKIKLISWNQGHILNQGILEIKVVDLVLNILKSLELSLVS